MPVQIRHSLPQIAGRRSAAVLGTALIIAGLCAAAALAQGAAGLIAQRLGDEEVPAGESSGEASAASALGVDRIVERLLQQADEYAAADRYADAIVIWQNVLDHARHGLITREDLGHTTFGGQRYQVFRPVRAEVERRLAGLPAAAVEIYRRSFDGAAAAEIREAGDDNPERLAEVVERFLLTSEGDEAASALAALYLDRGDFVPASRLLRRLAGHPAQPDVRPARILVRLALAEAALGDLPAARAALARAQQRSAAEADAREIERTRRALDQTARLASWPTPDSRIPRVGSASALPPQSYVARLAEAWSRSASVEIRERPASGGAQQPPGAAEALQPGGTVLSVADRPSTAEDAASLIESWRESDWVPAGDVLVDGSRAWFKGTERLIALDVDSGDVLWLGLRNRYELTWSAQAFGQAAANDVDHRRPTLPRQIQRFGDRIHHSLALIDDTIYSLEGPLLDYDSGETVTVEPAEGSRAIVRRSLQNRLSAYDARTGRLKWQCLPAELAAADGGRGFVAAPVAVRERLLAPVSHEGELWLYALDPASGRVEWQVFLCDEPPGGCSPWASVALAADGSEVYLATGAGLVFAIEGTSGRVQWAARYTRNGIRETQVTRPGAGFVVSADLDGWERDVVLIWGSQLIVTPSDYGYVIGLDRRDGRLAWHSPRQPSEDEPAADTCLGIAGGGLFVAGRSVVRRYDLPSGRLAWQALTGDSHGRGVVTADAVCVPVGNSVLRLDLATGGELSRSELIIPSAEPAGNLYCAGERLLCLSGERLYALSALETHLATLASRIASGDAAAQFQRMRLHVRLEQTDKAIADLTGACRLIGQQRGAEAQRAAVDAGLDELGLAHSHPRLVLELIAGTGAPAPLGTADPAAQPEAAARRAQLLHAAFRSIAEPRASANDGPRARVRRGSTVKAILAVAPYCRPPYLQLAARHAMAAAAGAAGTADGDVLREAVGAGDPAVRLLAVAGIVASRDDWAPPLLRGLLDDPDEFVRFEAALGLANRGDRAALPVLAGLLESDDEPLRHRNLAALRALTGQQFGYVASGPPGERTAKAGQWRQWIAEYGATAELRYPVRDTGLTLGRTLISYKNNRVVELDDRGRVVWQQEVDSPWGVSGLPNGHRLVASYSDRAVYEYDAEGRLVWRKTNLPSSPYSVERLENGRTLVACYSANMVLEIAQDGTVVHEIVLPDHPRDATRLANGHTLVALYTPQRVVEVDPQGRVVWEIRDMNRPVALQRLDNGNTIVCQYQGNQVVEIDRAGNVVWSKSGLELPCDAQRLPTGNTLIVDGTGVQEVDPGGRTVWQQPGGGATSVCRY